MLSYVTKISLDKELKTHILTKFLGAPDVFVSSYDLSTQEFYYSYFDDKGEFAFIRFFASNGLINRFVYYQKNISSDNCGERAIFSDEKRKFLLCLNPNKAIFTCDLDSHNKTQQTETEGVNTTDKNEPSQGNDEIAPKEPEK